LKNHSKSQKNHKIENPIVLDSKPPSLSRLASPSSLSRAFPHQFIVVALRSGDSMRWEVQIRDREARAPTEVNHWAVVPMDFVDALPFVIAKRTDFGRIFSGGDAR